MSDRKLVLPPPVTPDLQLLGDFFVSGDVTLGTLGEIYGLAIAPDDMTMTLADLFATHMHQKAKVGDRLSVRDMLRTEVGEADLAVDGVRMRVHEGSRLEVKQVSKQTLLNWLYAGKVPEPPRNRKGYRLWSPSRVSLVK